MSQYGWLLPEDRTASRNAGPVMRWFMRGHLKDVEGPGVKVESQHPHAWWQVMCLTGVDYFSTLGYQARHRRPWPPPVPFSRPSPP